MNYLTSYKDFTRNVKLETWNSGFEQTLDDVIGTRNVSEMLVGYQKMISEVYIMKHRRT